MLQVANETICRGGAEGQRITPEVPLEYDDGETGHTSPDHTKCGLAACETCNQTSSVSHCSEETRGEGISILTTVEKSKTWNHDQDHT